MVFTNSYCFTLSSTFCISFRFATQLCNTRAICLPSMSFWKHMFLWQVFLCSGGNNYLTVLINRLIPPTFSAFRYIHDRSQTFKSDEAKWSKLTRITPVGSFWGENTYDFEKIRWGNGLVCLCSSYGYDICYTAIQCLLSSWMSL